MNGQTFLCFFRAYSAGFQKTLYRVNVGRPNSKVLNSKPQNESVASIKQYIVDTITDNLIKPITTFNVETSDTLEGLLTVLLTGVSDSYPIKNSIKISLIDRDLGDGLKPAIKVVVVHQNVKNVTYYPIEEPVV